MKPHNFTFHFKEGPITVLAWGYKDAEEKAKAEAKNRGWDTTIIEEKDKKPKSKPIVLTPIDNALMFIIELEDVDSFDEQLDCIEALKRLRNKLKDKENAK